MLYSSLRPLRLFEAQTRWCRFLQVTIQATFAKHIYKMSSLTSPQHLPTAITTFSYPHSYSLLPIHHAVANPLLSAAVRTQFLARQRPLTWCHQLRSVWPGRRNAAHLNWLPATASIKNASSIVAKDMLSLYKGTDPGQPLGLFGQPYDWWESGAVWGSLVDYWNYTGDAQYVGLVQ